MALMNISLTGDTFTDYHLEDVGSSEYELEHDFFTKEDLVITTGAGGGGTPLSEGVDYQLNDEDTDLSDRVTAAVGSTRTVYHHVQIINATYQTGSLYHSGKYIADSNDADDLSDVLYPMLRGMILGLTLSNNVTDANNDIDVAAGKCLADGGDRARDVLVLSSSITKRLDASWAEGTNQGGLDSGSKASDTTYHVWVIKKLGTDTVDVLFSTSASSPSMPTGYTLKRRIGTVITDGSSNIIAFIQTGDEFLLETPILDINTTITTSASTHALTVPSGIKVLVLLNIIRSGGTNPIIYISSPDVTDQAPSSSVSPLMSISAVNSAQGITGGQVIVRTNTSSQVRARSTEAGTTFRAALLAWYDRRGKDEAA